MNNPITSISKKVSLVFYILLFLFTISSLTPIVTFVYWKYYPYEPLIIHDIRILNKPKIGGDLIYEVEYSKMMDLNSVVSKELVNGHRIMFPAVVSHVPLTGKDKRAVSKGVLHLNSIVPDKYYFKWSVTYSPNPVRTIVVSASTECFELK